MAFKYIRPAWAVKNITPSERLVLMGIVDFANDQGRCWPSQRTLADLTGMSERNVRRALDKLEIKGVIERKAHITHAGRRPDIITVNFQPDIMAAGHSVPPAKSASQPDNMSPQPDKVSREPVREPINEPNNGRPADAPVEVSAPSAALIARKFEEFWKVYPKRDGSNPRAPAEKKFTALVKSGTDPVAIIAGAGRYGDDMRKRGQERTPYVAQALTWLNQSRWKDYPPVSGVTVSSASPLGRPQHGERRHGRVYVVADTPEWDAWCRYRRASGGVAPTPDRDGGWYLDSEWPPGHANATAPMAA